MLVGGRGRDAKEIASSRGLRIMLMGQIYQDQIPLGKRKKSKLLMTIKRLLVMLFPKDLAKTTKLVIKKPDQVT